MNVWKYSSQIIPNLILMVTSYNKNYENISDILTPILQ